MKVYQVVEFRNGEEYTWGIYSTRENAIYFLNKMGWYNDEDFTIIEWELDKN